MTSHRQVGVSLSPISPPELDNLIGGSWLQPAGSDAEAQWNPSTGEQTGWLRYASTEQVDSATNAAMAASRGWSAKPLHDRLAMLGDIADGIASHREMLQRAIGTETGKTIIDARNEVRLSEALLRWLQDEELWRSNQGDSTLLPLGVMAGISLYHYPLLSPLWMLAPAIAAGNAFVLRPCTWSPSVAVLLGRISLEAGLPVGVLNIVQGSTEVVDRLLVHPGIAGLSYIGSGPWAKYMYVNGSSAGKRVQALGALRQIHVVLADADLDAAAQRVVASATQLAGQRWLAGTSVLVDTDVADQFLDAMVPVAAAISVGRADGPDVAMGPVIRHERRIELEARVERLSEMALVVLDGRVGRSEPGFFVRPTLIDSVTIDSELWTDEVPGPLVSVLRLPPVQFQATLASCPHGMVGAIHGDASRTTPHLPFSLLARNSAIPELETGTPMAAWPPAFFGASYWNGADQIAFVTRRQVTV